LLRHFLCDIKQIYYIRQIDTSDTSGLKYATSNNIVFLLHYDVDNKVVREKEQLTLLKKYINSVKKEMGINWFDNSILLLEKSDDLEYYNLYLNQLNLKFTFCDNIITEYDNCRVYSFNEWKFKIIKVSDHTVNSVC